MKKKIKKYIAENEELMKEWDYEANEGLNPKEITIGSSKKVWWKCHKCGYKWQKSVSTKLGCPLCANRILIEGKNDLASQYPEIANEWHPDKNGNCLPNHFQKSSHFKAFWKCSECGYEWKASINNRTGKKSGCPRCKKSAGCVEGFTDFSTTHPELMKEWDYNKNDISPTEIKAGSSKKVWWKCLTCGFSWKTSVYSRIKGSGCPHCMHTNQTSFPEQAIYFYVKKIYPDAINRYKADFLGRMELDIYIPQIRLGIEYDGLRWHTRDKIRQEQKKYKICKQHHIKLIRIKEKLYSLDLETLDIADDQFEIVKYNNEPDLEETIKFVLKRINWSQKDISFNLNADENAIREMYHGKIKNSLAKLFPEIAKEWHQTKNENLKPEYFYPGSEYRAWWVCPNCKYEYQATIKHRTSRKQGCPLCSHQRLVVGKNDLATTHPELAKEWHPTKNGIITPQNIITGMGKKFWWQCAKCGYEWEATIAHRKFSKSGCPLCANKVLVSGVNDLETKYPNIAKEWDYNKNIDLTPQNIHCGSSKKVWWKCSICGKSWESSVKNRTHYNTDGCHSCNATTARKLRKIKTNQLES